MIYSFCVDENIFPRKVILWKKAVKRLPTHHRRIKKALSSSNYFFI